VWPDSHRQTVLLNGPWELWLDHEHRWSKKDWIDDFLSLPHKQVTIPWESMRTQMERDAMVFRVPGTWDEYQPNSTGEGWYWREIFIPETALGAVVRIIFCAVRYGAEVYLDGKRVALSLGGFTPFEADLTGLVMPGSRHELVVRVVNPGGGEAGNWDKLFFENIQIPQSHNFGGIWQDVMLLATSPVFIEDIFVEPRPQYKLVQAHFTVRNQTQIPQAIKISAQAVLEDPTLKVAGRADKAINVPAQGRVTTDVALQLEPMKLWEPDHPARYGLVANLKGSSSQIEDDCNVMFGMREFVVQGRFFYLNGRKFMVKSAINHQYYPVTVGYPPTPEFARKEIEDALESGLNMMHIHRQVGYPGLLDRADEMGLLLYEEVGGTIFDISHHLDYPGIRLLLHQLSGVVRRDRNHPALVAWGMSNENILDSEVSTHMMRLTRELDPTRVVCDNSGHGLKMLHPYETIEKPWRDLHFYPPAPVAQETRDSLLHFGRPPGYSFRLPDQREVLPPMPEAGPQIVGEIGYGGLPDIPANVREFKATSKQSVEGADWEGSQQYLQSGFRRYNLEQSFGSISAFCAQTEEVHAEALVEMLQALRSNPFNSGYAVSCFHDLATWYCGITDIFRTPKISGKRLAEVNSPLYLSLYGHPSPTWTNTHPRVWCTVINENVLNGPAELIISVIGPQGEALRQESVPMRLEPGQSFVSPPIEREIALSGTTGYYSVRAELKAGGVSRAANKLRLYAVNAADIVWPDEPIYVYDLHQQLLPFLARSRAPYRIWSPGVKSDGQPILVGELNRWYYLQHRARVQSDMDRLLEQCRLGSVASFFMGSIGGGDDGLIDVLNDLHLQTGSMRLAESEGNFRGCFHFVKSHDLFAGLPVNTCMDAAYRNVVAQVSLEGFEGETVVGCNQNAFWWGTDAGIIPLGMGRAVFLTLRIPKNLGSDPVAERIMTNVTHWRPK
jgi:hypothetical protein